MRFPIWLRADVSTNISTGDLILFSIVSLLIFVSVLDLKKLGSDWLIVIGRMLMEAALDPDGLLFLLGSVVVVVVVVAVVAAAGAVVGFCLFPD